MGITRDIRQMKGVGADEHRYVKTLNNRKEEEETNDSFQSRIRKLESLSESTIQEEKT